MEDIGFSIILYSGAIVYDGTVSRGKDYFWGRGAKFNVGICKAGVAPVVALCRRIGKLVVLVVVVCIDCVV